jgi:hypothetical protein
MWENYTCLSYKFCATESCIFEERGKDSLTG